MGNVSRIIGGLITSLITSLAALALSAPLYAADKNPAGPHKISFIPSANAAVAPLGESARDPATLAGEPLAFGAPPRESAEDAYRLYKPVAEYLSRALGRPVVYVYPKTWLSYQKEMIKGAYDIAFDGAHFTSWRISHLQHTAIARIPEQQVYAVITRQDATRIADLKQLAGQKVCAMGASNLATLALLAEFEPMRQPLVLEQVGWSKVYEGVVEGRCVAGTLPLAVLRKLDGASAATRVLHRSKPLPNQAFSAGPRLDAQDRQALAQALTSTEGRRALTPLLAANGAEQGLALAAREDYAGMDAYLKDVWGYTR